MVAIVYLWTNVLLNIVTVHTNYNPDRGGESYVHAQVLGTSCTCSTLVITI